MSMRAGLAALLLAFAPVTGADSASAPGDGGEVQPRFLWGVVIRYVAGEVFSAFAQWVATKITDAAAPGAPPPGQSMALLSIEHLRNRRDTTGGAVIVANPRAAAAASRQAPAVTFEQPARPIEVRAGGPNYQGVHIAIVGADAAGALTELRPIRSGFRTGERFKLRAVSTFGGLLVIHNINPKGVREQIYPADADAVVALQPGGDTLLPLGRDEFFEFTRSTGEEQIVIVLRDPRAVGEAASREAVHRKDEDYGSNFVQQVTAKTFPAMSESIRVRHF